MSRKRRSKTPTKEDEYVILPRNNEDFERLGWTRIAISDKECARLKSKNKEKEKVGRSCRICTLFSVRSWPF